MWFYSFPVWPALYVLIFIRLSPIFIIYVLAIHASGTRHCFPCTHYAK